MVSIILGLIVTKFLSGYIGGRLVSFSKKNSVLFGVATVPQLTTTLAVIYAVKSLGLLDNILTTSIIVLAIVTTIAGPALLNILANPVQPTPTK